MVEVERIEKNFVEFLIPGIMVAETSTKECTEETRKHPETVDFGDHYFAFRFFRRTFTTVNGETLKGEPRDKTGWFYEGYEMPVDEVMKLGSKHHILKDNVDPKYHTYRGVVWTMFGQVMPLDKDDVVIKHVPLRETPLWKSKVGTEV
jgi:hypothetical protein